MNLSFIKDSNDFFRDWIKEEWKSHNETDLFYQLDLKQDVEFKEGEFYYKILKDNEMIGFVGLMRKDDKLFHSHILYVYRLYIDKEYRNQGIGTEVMKWIIHMAKQENRDIELECHGKNPAIHLYERMGFQVNFQNMILKMK